MLPGKTLHGRATFSWLESCCKRLRSLANSCALFALVALLQAAHRGSHDIEVVTNLLASSASRGSGQSTLAIRPRGLVAACASL
jgi:hypothetical protein